MPEQDSLIRFEKPSADQIDQPGPSPAGINWIEQQTFPAGEKMQRFLFRRAQDAVTLS